MTTTLQLNTEALNRVCERLLSLENRMVRLEDKMDRILVMFSLPPYKNGG
jgi:hypothetical protein